MFNRNSLRLVAKSKSKTPFELGSRFTGLRISTLGISTWNLTLFPPLTLSLMGLISACSQDNAPNPTSPSSYFISTILPNPAEAGTEVTLYGKLPAQARVKVAGESIPLILNDKGGSFKLPNKIWAGTHSFTLEKAATATDPVISLTNTLSVLPRILQTAVEGDTLLLGGLGWKKNNLLIPGTFVEIEGQIQQSHIEGLALAAPMPSKLWGNLTVRVNVAGLYSQPFTLLRQAASVKGKVILPGVTTAGIWSGKITTSSRAKSQRKAILINNLSSSNLLSSQSVVAQQEQLTGLIAFSKPNQLKELQQVAATLEGISRTRALPPLNALSLHFQNHDLTQKALLKLQNQASVKTLEWDVPVRLETSSQAPVRLSSQADDLGTQWFWDKMAVPSAWEKTQGEGVTVAILDTGVVSAHPDLRANLLPGYDFVDGDDDPSDKVGHGTHVAGLIAAKGQVQGAAPRAKILPVRVLSNEGGDASNVAQGLLWAAGLLQEPPNPYPAQIINLSLGSSNYSEVLAQAVNAVLDKGILIVAATGNSSGPLAYPAALEGVLAVTAVAGPLEYYQPSYANRGDGVSLSAYGGDYADRDDNGIQDAILSTDRNADGSPGYGLRAGTSMATPEVSGIAALALSSGVPLDKLKDTLERTATDLGSPGYDTNFGYGLINAGFISSTSAKVYVLAFRGDEIISWTVVDAEGNYTLANLPPETALHILAISDNNANGVLGEADEWISPTQDISLLSGAQKPLEDLQLERSSGDLTYRLP
jgi:serine protease